MADLNTKASQDTFISLLLLDPTPIASRRPEEAGAGAGPDTSSRAASPASPTPPSHATIKSHGAVYYLVRIQRYASYVFTVFTIIHFATTSVIPLAAGSVGASESYMLIARELYQTPLSEPLLVCIPTAAHVASGLALRLLRRSQNLERYGGATPGVAALHRAKTTTTTTTTSTPSLLPTPGGPWPPLSTLAATGYAFALLLGAHAAVNRALPRLVHGDSAQVGLAFVAHAFARRPAPSAAAYAALLGLGAGHMVWGWARWVGVAPPPPPPPRRPDATGNRAVDRARTRARRRTWVLVNGLVAGLAVAWAAGGLGVVARGGAMPGWLGQAYDELLGRVPFC